MTVDQAMQTAITHHQAGQLAEAEVLYRQVLAEEPQNPDALHLLGVIAHQTGYFDAAVDLIVQAISGKPDDAALHSNLGEAYRAQGRLDEAVTCYQRALALQPNYPEASNNLGEAYRGLDRHDEALACYQQALALRPDYFEAHNNLGIIFEGKGQLDAAIDCFQNALSIRPDYAEAHNNLANVFSDQGRLEGAIGAYRGATRLQPEAPFRLSSLIFALHFHPDYDAKKLSEEHREWETRHAAPRARFQRPHTNDPDPKRRLKIGYVSPDLREHPIGHFLRPLLAHHDHDNFEITCYADVAKPDTITDSLREYADRWRVTVSLSEEQLAEQIRSDGIDILVDMALHTAGNRLPVFARKPAPVQVSFAGYPATTGLDAIDYRLSDRFLDPPGQKTHSSEEVIRLPDSFWLFTPPDNGPSVSPLPALAMGHITFGCLGSFSKVNAQVIKLWARVMNAVPDSRLLLLAAEGSHRERTREMLQGLGIMGARVEFVGRDMRLDYLALYGQVDILLDTFPYNGHNTSLDALWMGVPVVSLVGKTAVGRGGLSILSNIGLPELAAQDEDEYVKIAVELANDLPRLNELRATMRAGMQASPLMDAPRFARNMEAAYRAMWKKWCESRVISPEAARP